MAEKERFLTVEEIIHEVVFQQTEVLTDVRLGTKATVRIRIEAQSLLEQLEAFQPDYRTEAVYAAGEGIVL